MSYFNLIIESKALAGVHKIAEKLQGDFQAVTGHLPPVSDTLSPTSDQQSIVIATLGHTDLIDEGDFSDIAGKWECYKIVFKNQVLYIVGSDKRGTIYGMFTLSAYMGVSPLHYFGDVTPKANPTLHIGTDIECTSKEPSVKYRGFFINDEWPCFGNWTFGKFGGFTAEMYDHVFELLLRLKGNYLWPAMWTSAFPMDGPGQASEELADLYGVVMGASHHEPLLRASEEWDKVNAHGDSQSTYGTDWNYHTNKTGLDNYWTDAIKRSGHLEKVITIGMRGERDTSMLGSDSTIQENVDLLKDIITAQKAIIDTHAHNKDNDQMIAIYKEVEAYFWGLEGVDGLKNWDGLGDTILMLCEDNFGFTRGLPTADFELSFISHDSFRPVDSQQARFGMYYHFDYHGGPISYEWVMSTQLERAWDQMTTAYDHGIRDIWVVNVGDLKFNEVQLAFFLALAFDTNTTVSQWLEAFTHQHFTSQQAEIGQVLQDLLKLNSIRRPEALNANVFHPTHHNETDTLLGAVYALLRASTQVYNNLTDDEKDAFYSMIHYPVLASMTNYKMHLYSTKNQALANQGKPYANVYADRVKAKIDQDKALSEEFRAFKQGKWAGMELAPHIGFTIWNEDNNRLPLRTYVEPVDHPRLSVSKSTSSKVHYKTYGGPMVIDVSEFLYAGHDSVTIEVANDGSGSFEYLVHNDTDWVLVDQPTGTVSQQTTLTLTVDRDKLTEAISETRLHVIMLDKENRDKANPQTMNKVALEVKARNLPLPQRPKVHMAVSQNTFVIEAHNYAVNTSAPAGEGTEAGFKLIPNYGRSLTPDSGVMKVAPSTARFAPRAKQRPELAYYLQVDELGDYMVEVWSVPTNPVTFRGDMQFMLNGRMITAVDNQFDAGNPHYAPWSQGVLDNIRKTLVPVRVKKAGIKGITIGAIDPNFILEKLVVYKVGHAPAESYLGPQSSYVTP